jgi:2-hydroxy-3-keto-5-methylthiopentenyl-1-phosphate phosphatase
VDLTSASVFLDFDGTLTVADVLFAKGRLAEWCELSGVEHVPFETLAGVQAALCQ